MASHSKEPGASAAGDAALAAALMRRQAALGMRVAAGFLGLLLGLPLLSEWAPELTALPVLGFPLAWFILGLLVYPITWVMSAYFVRASERLEAEEAELVRRQRREAGAR